MMRRLLPPVLPNATATTAPHTSSRFLTRTPGAPAVVPLEMEFPARAPTRLTFLPFGVIPRCSRIDTAVCACVCACMLDRALAEHLSSHMQPCGPAASDVSSCAVSVWTLLRVWPKTADRNGYACCVFQRERMPPSSVREKTETSGIATVPRVP
jgi:hypothetical protein